MSIKDYRLKNSLINVHYSVFSSMRSLLVVPLDPLIKIGLQ